MIVDKIENAHLYSNLFPNLARALEVSKNTDLSEKADGRYDIDGDNLFYFVQRYTTKPIEQGKLETHQDYIDIQFVASGEELLGYAPLDDLEVTEPYNPEKDVAFYKTPANLTPVNLSAGMFCVLYPADAHMPGCQLNQPAQVLKAVVKVKINVD